MSLNKALAKIKHTTVFRYSRSDCPKLQIGQQQRNTAYMCSMGL